MEFKKRNPKIYVIAGQARHGKDSLADAILNYYEEIGKEGIRLQFAYYIKEYAKKICDWDGSEENKPRELLQQLGTELVRKQIDEKLFINRTIQDIELYSYFFDVIVISDARYDLEIESIKKNFPSSQIIRVLRPNMEHVLGKLESHETERGLINDLLYDVVIHNDGSLEDLNKKVRTMIDKLEHKK